MPVLYYNWKPTFASQPHRASTRAGTAELGSMAMEFTRLAQLTKEPRYYDAVARITNALEEFQNRGTGLGGVFPGDLDASGCNWTLPDSPEPLEEPKGYEPLVLPKETSTNEASNTKDPEKIEFQVIDDGTGQSKGRIHGWEDNHNPNRENGSLKAESAPTPRKRLRRQLNDPSIPAEAAPPPAAHKSGAEVGDADVAIPGPYAGPVLNLPTTSSSQKTWDCLPQGLTGASKQYSMGGGQDSTYEYFPKQYVLLGGLEDKYRTMYLKTIDTVRQQLLYRPMLPDNRDILFSGKVSKDMVGGLIFDAEVTHLTCFIGGMVGMGAKLFGIESDLEIAKRLTDGCVWAYESMPSGIMPETAKLLPCESANNCVWNQTLYFETLDPIGATRDDSRAEYFKNKELAAKAEFEAAKAKAEAVQVEAEADRLALAANTAAEVKEAAKQEEARRLAAMANTTLDTVKDSASADEAALLLKSAKDYKPISEHTPFTEVPDGKPEEHVANPIQKRQINMAEETKLPITHNLADEAYELSKAAQNRGSGKPSPTVASPDENGASGVQQGKIPVVEEGFTKKLEQTELELGSTSQSSKSPIVESLPKLNSIPNIATGQEPLLSQDPMAPLSHEQFIANKIENESLPPGYMMIQNRKYILRYFHLS